MNKLAWLSVGFLLLSACASKPILLPNGKYNRVGHERSERDIDQCMNAADNQLKKTRGRRVLRGAVTGAAVGAGIGALAGPAHNGVIGNAIGGAAVGGAAGSLMGAASTPEQAKRRIVNYCLRKKGYDVAGWD